MSYEYEGFYLFGGLNEHGEALNDCWVLKFTEDGYFWSALNNNGAPLARYKHTSTYLKNMIVVYGGRNDSLRIDFHSVCDVGLYMLERQKWEVLHISNDPPLARWDHCAETIGNKIFIFGGQNYKRNITNAIHVLEYFTKI